MSRHATPQHGTPRHRTSQHRTSETRSQGPVAVVLGTRPEIIKLAMITELLGEDAHIVHTGQHFDANLSDDFFTEFGMRPPDTHLGVGSQTRGAQIGNATTALDELFSTLRPSAVVVQGDTNAVLAGALAANANEIPLVHVEAGLRSFDKRMPEEHNRLITDHLSDLCLAPTALNVANLAAEGIVGEGVVETGNTIVEAVERLLPQESERAKIAQRLGVTSSNFVLATLHRPENVDDPDTLANILDALVALEIPVLVPLHPRTRKRIAEFGLEGATEALHIVDPVGFRDFIALGAQARLVVSDSGGIQEEVSVYKRPCVVIRRSTERPEVEGTFVERFEPGPVLASQLAAQLDRAGPRAAELAALPSPYGDADAPQRCVDALRTFLTDTR